MWNLTFDLPAATFIAASKDRSKYSLQSPTENKLSILTVLGNKLFHNNDS